MADSVGVSGLDRLTRGARLAMQAALLLTLTGWVLDLPAYVGRYYYTEQFLALAAGFASTLTLLEAPDAFGPSLRWLNAVFAGLMLALFVYVAFNYPSLQLMLALAPTYAVALGVVMIVGILEAVRRRTGPFLPVLLLLLGVFVFIGPYLPSAYETRPVTFSRLIVYLALDTNALFSRVLAIAAIVVAPFIVFGFLLNGFGGAAIFSTLAARLVGNMTGGPAKVSVVGSAAFGMVSGSAVANVAAVGSISIPMMTRAGYARHVAAAIEAIASTGGQLAPPIMGASAFLMAELLELPYRDVALAAILPAILFYVALILAVDFEARRQRLSVDQSEVISFGPTVAAGWRYVFPVGVLLYLLFWENRTAEYAGLIATVALVITHFVWPPRDFLNRIREIVDHLLRAMGVLADIIMLAAAAGLIIGVLNITGISFAITLQMVALSGGVLAILLVITALLSLLLGLGMPTVGVYILLATLLAPALVELGVAPIAAHMYVLFFGMISMITPPVAIASFAAAAVAAADPWRTSFASLRIGAGLYLIPFAFVTQPVLLLHDDPTQLLIVLPRILLAITLLTAAAVGHAGRPISPPVRLLGAGLAIVHILPIDAFPAPIIAWAISLAGLVILGVHARPLGKKTKAHEVGQLE